MRTIVVYPGRFQPFGKHHYEVYKWLINKFGKDNVYISTSNVVGKDSPLNFEEKSDIIVKFGISRDKICQSDRPYMPVDLLNKFNRELDRLIVVYGEKDYGRIQFTKKDGSPTYFKRYFGQLDLNPFKDSAYVLVAPHVQLNHKGSEICGTYLRQVLSNCTRRDMIDLMGWTDEGIYALLKQKFREDYIYKKTQPTLEAVYPVDSFKTILEASTDNQGKYSRHITHPFECNMMFSDLKRFVYDVTENCQSLKSTLKLDGYNLQVTVKNMQVMCSRNKNTVISPMSYDQLSQKYADRPEIQFVFCEAFKSLEMALLSLEKTALNTVFDNGRNFLNFEILHDRTSNVLKFEFPAISLHSVITYDYNGNELYRTNTLPIIFESLFYKSANGFTFIKTPEINLNPILNSNTYSNKLLLIQHRYKIPESTNLLEITGDALTEIKAMIFEMGNAVIKRNYNSPDSKNNVNQVIKIVEWVGDNLNGEEELSKYNSSLYLLDKLGGYSSINPIEGFVIQWNNKVVKLTGTYGALVPIFGIWNKKRF